MEKDLEWMGRAVNANPVQRAVLQDMCRALGYNPDQVKRISLHPDRVVVDLIVTSRWLGTWSLTETRAVSDG
jgi:hypothetical protein